MNRTYPVVAVSLLVAVALAQAQEYETAVPQTQYAPEHAIIESGAAGSGRSFDPAPDAEIDRIVPRDLDPIH